MSTRDWERPRADPFTSPQASLERHSLLALAASCLLLAACGPVLLYGDEQLAHDAGEVGIDGASPLDEKLPRVVISVKPTDCRCFELTASGIGGVPPYQFEWNDGVKDTQRSVCVSEMALDVSVVVEDASAARAAGSVTRLEPAASASCPPPSLPGELLCVVNPSFEGTPAPNLGPSGSFDAPPWSACTEDPSTPNMPNVANAQTSNVPEPTQGETFLGLVEGNQASQKLCKSVQGGVKLSLRLDVARLDLTGGFVPDTEAVFLEISGGIAANCSQREVLWRSERLELGWKPFCVDLKPTQFMDLITLRATSDNSQLTPSMLLVDNLVPVTACP